VIEVNGAPGTLYANETYQLQVDFPEHYPMEAPQVNNRPHIYIYINIYIFLLFPSGRLRKNIGKQYGSISTLTVVSVEWVFVNHNSMKFFQFELFSYWS